MKYTKLGNTDITVSRICVGCMSYGIASEDFHLWTLPQEKTTEMVKHAYDLGVNFFDTANCYSHGTSEEFLGKALRGNGIRRDKVVIASKVYYNDGALSRMAIRREIEGTLTRLGTDYLDLYQIHRFDYGTPMEETMETLNDLIKEGKVRAIGASAMFGYQLHNLQLTAERNGWHTFQTLQDHYNLINREDERELIPVAEQYSMSRIPYSPLAGGHLSHEGWETESLRSKTDRLIRLKYDKTKDCDMQIISRVAELAKSYGVNMPVIALAWLFKKGVTAPIVGATSAKHFDDAVKSVDFTLNDEDTAYLEELYFPHEMMGAIKPPKQ